MNKDKGIFNTINYWNENYPKMQHLGISSTESEKGNLYLIKMV